MKERGHLPVAVIGAGPHEQVRSVVAEIAGDHQAARDVRLVLRETGVCSASLGSEESAPVQIGATLQTSCCGGPSPEQDGACCLKDHEAKNAGDAGCGCRSKPIEIQPSGQPSAGCCSV